MAPLSIEDQAVLAQPKGGSFSKGAISSLQRAPSPWCVLAFGSNCKKYPDCRGGVSGSGDWLRPSQEGASPSGYARISAGSSLDRLHEIESMAVNTPNALLGI